MFYDRFALGNTLAADRYNGHRGAAVRGDESVVLSEHPVDRVAERFARAAGEL